MTTKKKPVASKPDTKTIEVRVWVGYDSKGNYSACSDSDEYCIADLRADFENVRCFEFEMENNKPMATKLVESK